MDQSAVSHINSGRTDCRTWLLVLDSAPQRRRATVQCECDSHLAVICRRDYGSGEFLGTTTGGFQKMGAMGNVTIPQIFAACGGREKRQGVKEFP